MFTGIIESLAEVQSITSSNSNLDIWIKSKHTPTLKIDQSVSHNGICLTVVEISEDTYRVTAIKETIDKTTVGAWKDGQLVNFERAMTSGGRFDGHWVQGHVDTTARLTEIVCLEGSWAFYFSFEKKEDFILVKKGSVTIDGVSLTVVNVDGNNFSVNIIPYTFEHTLFGKYVNGQMVNIEFDILGKYIQSMLPLYLQDA
jgi:riboflavin synthase